MKTLILISITALVANQFVCNTSLAAGKSTTVKSNRAIQLRPGSADRWFIDGRFVTVPNVAEVNKDMRLAQTGDAHAQFRLALRYDRGHGVQKNPEKAVMWLRKAAEQGYAEAEYNLGSMYDEGLGVEQDFAEATRWYRRAAEKGFASAQLNLGAKYGRGEGTAQSHSEAYIWSSVAVMSGNKNAINNRDTAASALSAKQLEDAQKRALTMYEGIQQRKKSS